MRGDSSSVKGVDGSEMAQQEEFTPNLKISVHTWDPCRLSASTVMCVHAHMHTDRHTCMQIDTHVHIHAHTHIYTL